MNAMMTEEADIHIFTMHEHVSKNDAVSVTVLASYVVFHFHHSFHIRSYILIPNGNFQPKISSIDAERMYANDHTGNENKESTQRKKKLNRAY